MNAFDSDFVVPWSRRDVTATKTSFWDCYWLCGCFCTHDDVSLCICGWRCTCIAIQLAEFIAFVLREKSDYFYYCFFLYFLYSRGPDCTVCYIIFEKVNDSSSINYWMCSKTISLQKKEAVCGLSFAIPYYMNSQNVRIWLVLLLQLFQNDRVISS